MTNNTIVPEDVITKCCECGKVLTATKDMHHVGIIMEIDNKLEMENEIIWVASSDDDDDVELAFMCTACYEEDEE